MGRGQKLSKYCWGGRENCRLCGGRPNSAPGNIQTKVDVSKSNYEEKKDKKNKKKRKKKKKKKEKKKSRK